MKKLYLIRHAKAEDYSLAKKDYDRNLIAKGKERAKQIATLLKEEFVLTPQTKVLSSSANRAIQTAELFCKILNYPVTEIRQDKNIYEARYLDILKSINSTADSVENLLVFGHNPGLSDLTHYLTDAYVDLKTSEVAIIELEEGIDFTSLAGGTASLSHVIDA